MTTDKRPPLQINLGLPELSPLTLVMLMAAVGFNPVAVLEEVVRPILRNHIYLWPVNGENIRWYPLKIPDGATYSEPVLNGQAEIGIGYTQQSLLLMLPRTLDPLLQERLRGTAEGPTHFTGRSGAPASGWRFRLKPKEPLRIPLPGGFNIYLELV